MPPRMSLDRRLAVLAALAGLGAVGLVAGAVPVRPVVQARAPAQVELRPLAFVPYIVRRWQREQLTPPATQVPPTATPTATPTLTPTPTPTITPSPTITPTPEDCPPLHERVQVAAVSVAPKKVQLSGKGWDGSRPVSLAVAPNGDLKVAWSDESNQLWVTPLTRDFQRAGPDQAVDGTYSRGFVAHDDGAALVVRRGPDDMYLVRIENDGQLRWQTQIVGQKAQTVVGSKWVDSWGDEGRLAWTGSEYLVYLGHTQYFGAQGKHQGDLLWHYGPDGVKVADDQAVAWDWGCSHSLDVRLTLRATAPAAVCLSDCYPEKAMMFNNQRRIRSEPSGNCSGSSDSELGGLVPDRTGGFWFSFISKETRGSHDLGLVHLSDTGFKDEDLWLTNTPGVQETSAHLARHGRDVFAAWVADGKPLGAVVDGAGKFVQGPDELGAGFGARDDLVNLPNGDIAWAYAWGGREALQIVRVAYCTR